MMGSMFPGRYLVSCMFSNPQYCDEVGDNEYLVFTPEKSVDPMYVELMSTLEPGSNGS